MKTTSEISIGDVQPHWRVGIVCSQFYSELISSMENAARELLEEAGIAPENISTHSAPGSFEIPLIGASLAKASKIDALIGLGIIVQGETEHAQLIADATVKGMMDVQVQYGVPFACEVLLVNSLEDAKERSEGEFNKGKEAARAVLHSLSTMQK